MCTMYVLTLLSFIPSLSLSLALSLRLSHYTIPRPPKVKKIMYDWDFCIVGTIGTLELKTSLSQEDLNALIWIHPLCLTLFFFVTVLTPTDLQP